MLANEDYLVALKWAKSIGGLKGLIARADGQCARWSGTSAPRTPGSPIWPKTPAIASTTSVCLKFTDPRITDGEAFAKAVAKRLEKAGVGL